jgi:hypothetical protein
MASNFHNILGILTVGVDRHKGLQVAPPAPPGAPIPEFPFWELVCAHPFIMGPNQKPTVKINGVPSVVLGHEPLLLWPHYPLNPMNAFWPLDLIFGSQSCWLPRGTVFICDEVSTCAVYEAVTMTLDCADPCKMPTNLTLQFGTVKTTPSPADFFAGALQWAVDTALSVITDKVLKPLGKKLGKKLGKRFGGKGKGLLKKLGDPAHKLAVRLTKSGKGYQLAKKLGGKFTGKYSQGLTKRATSGYAKRVGRQITEEFLKRAGVGAGDVGKAGLEAVGWDPKRMLPTNPEGAQQPFGGWPGGQSMADKHVPLYGGVHGVVQGIGGIW